MLRNMETSTDIKIVIHRNVSSSFIKLRVYGCDSGVRSCYI